MASKKKATKKPVAEKVVETPVEVTAPAVEETEPAPEEVEEKIDEKVLMFKNVLANAKQKEVLKQKKIYSAMPDIKIVRN